jgi:FkbM family methyltransferase
MRISQKNSLLHVAQKGMDYIGLHSSKIPFLGKIYNSLRWIRSKTIVFLDPNSYFINQVIKTINYYDIDLVIDVGAGEGEFALELIRAGYKNKIISIEPVLEAYCLLKDSSRVYKNWVIFPRMAAGEVNKLTKINVSKNSVSSSLLRLLPVHLKAAKDSKYIKQENVGMYKLDSFFNEFRKYKNILIKIDAQGYESYILEGAKKILESRNLKGLLIETSFVRLYRGQKLFDYLYKKMTDLGFNIWGEEEVLVDRSTGRLLQANFLMFKSVK